MLNTKTSASKNQPTPRSPLKLKDLNISSEAPTGCLSFFLPNHCNTTKNASINKPIFQDLRGKLVKKGKTLANPDCFTPTKVKSGEINCSRYDLSHGVNKFTSGFEFKVCDYPLNVVNSSKNSEKSSGFELKVCDYPLNVISLRKNSEKSSGFEYVGKDADEMVLEPELESNELKVLLGESRNIDADVRKCSSRCDISDGIDTFSDFTAVNKLGFSRNDTNCADDSISPTPPPVQASVSLEIRGRLTSGVTATPTACYAAGYVLSGATDKRKCRPKGLRTIGSNSLFGSSKMKGFENESGVGEVNSRRDSTVSSPVEASACWLASPCVEERTESCCTNELRLNQGEKLVPFKLVVMSSSPSSSLGFSSELFDKSDCTISASNSSITTPNSRKSKRYVPHSDSSSEFRGVLGSSFDHLVRSPFLPSCNVDFLPQEGIFCYDHDRLGIPESPNMEDSLGSGNVMQTPDSNSSRCGFRLSHSPKPNSSSHHFGLSDLSRDQISRLWFECELDSVTEVLRRVSLSSDCQIAELDSPIESLEFNPLIKLDNSVDTLFREAMDTRPPNNSEVRISWREGLANRMFEIDELDCCRYLSDEDYNSDCGSDTSESCSCPRIAANVSDKIAEDSLLYEDSSVSRKQYKSSSFDGPKLCRKSRDDDGRDTRGPDDSSWTVCYENNLFQA